MSEIQSTIPGGLSALDISTLASAGVIPAGTPPAVVAVFATNCKQHGLSPFKKEIYLVKYGSIYATIVGIDGFRNKATRTGQYAGIDDAKFNLQPNGQYETAAQLKAAGKLPTTCTITAYRIVGGIRCPYTHTAVFSEFAGSGKWQTMPFQMIQKVAEAFCLKKGFADELGGLHIEEEREAFTGETVDVEQQNAPLHEDYKDELKMCKTKSEIKAVHARQFNNLPENQKTEYYQLCITLSKDLPE